MNKYFPIFAVVLVFAVMFAVGVWADGSTAGTAVIDPGQEAAEKIYCGVRGLVTGNLGTMAGMIIAFAGLYTFIMSDQVTGGLMMLAGIALTALPGFYEAFMGGYNHFFGKERVANFAGAPTDCPDS